MAVDAVVGGVGGAVLEPFDRDVGLGERRVLDLAERLHPGDAFGLLGPETIGIGERSLVHRLVVGGVDEGALGPGGGHIVNLVRHFLSSTRTRCLGRSFENRKRLFRIMP